MNNFLSQHGWSIKHEIGQDASSRRYYRVFKGEQRAIFMEGSTTCDMPGHRLNDFIRIGAWLREIGLSVPEIYEADEMQGFALLEDFGECSFKTALDQGIDKCKLYTLGANILQHLSAQNCPLGLPNYYDSHVHAGRSFVLEHYYPHISGQKPSQKMLQEYLNIWANIEAALPPCPQGFLHVDFHAENLMWRPAQTGLKCCGILDFQGAMIGPKPYDLANLLEDVRRDVPKEIRAKILARYDENFRSWYRVLATQFHCRVIGQFIKMASEGKPQYLEYISRVKTYIHEALNDPLLEELKEWFDRQDLQF